MKLPNIFTTSAVLLLLSSASFAEEVDLPAPVLKWSFYILLMFAAVVAIGITIFLRGKNGAGSEQAETGQSGLNGKDESLLSLLGEKDAGIHSVRPNISVSDCVSEMNEKKIGAMLVMVEDKLLGMFTERDALTRVLGAGLDPTLTNVSKVMTNRLFKVTPTTTLDEAMALVTQKRIRHLPVVEDGKVVGMVSSGDLTRRLVEDQAGEIRELVKLAGRRGATL